MRNVARVIINAPSDYILKSLLDNSFFAQCEQNCIKIVGHFEDGRKVRVYCKQGARTVVKRYVINIIPHQQIVLNDVGLFSAKKIVRTIKIIAKDDDTSEVVVEEMYAGFLFEKGWLKIPEANDAVAQFALRLKKLIEARPM